MCNIVEKIQFSIGDPNMIRKLSKVEITIAELFDNNVPKFSGLFDLRMGPSDTSFICKTCRHTLKDCPGHLGHIELAVPVYYIHFLGIIRKILQCICFTCSSLLIDSKNIVKIIEKKKNLNRLKIVSKICNNNKNVCKNIDGCGRIQPKYTKDNVYIYVHHELESENKIKVEKKTILTAEECYKILKRISDKDLLLLGFNPKYSKPEWLICTVLPVSPPCVRPSIKHDANLRSEDDLTYKLLDIVKANNNLKNKLANNDKTHIKEYIEYLQYHITTLIDNEVSGIPPAQQRTGRLLKSLKHRLKGKDGRFRGNLVGKRVDFSARSVVSPDPNLNIDELGVPKIIAMNMTFPEKVNKYNIKYLQYLVNNGPTIYPGAKYIIKNNERIDLRFANKINCIIKEGDIIERHLINGDNVLFNRQPSLHKMSMMGHKVKIIDYNTFRLNPSVTSPYNADFDGDEMNLYLPQSIQTSIELNELVMVPSQIISPQSNKPVIGCIMDCIVGTSLITKKNKLLNEHEVYKILASFSSFDGNLPEPYKIKKGTLHEPDEKLWTGRQIFSLILPKINYYKSNEKENIIIHNGKLIQGVCDKSVIGTGSGSLIHTITNDLGSEYTKEFLNNIQRMINFWLQKEGFSVGLGDTIANKKIKNNIYDVINKAKGDVLNLISITRSSNNKLQNKTRDELENSINNILNQARDETGGYATKSLNENNSLNNMVVSGSKGNFINISQIMSVVGPQSVTSGSKRGRISYGFDERTLPHFQKYDDGPKSRGFVENSYLQGLEPAEFFFHAMSGREGLIDTAVKTSETGYIQRKIIKAMEDIKISYDLTVRNNKNSIIQFLYGGDGINALKIERQLFEILNYNKDKIIDIYKWDINDLKTCLLPELIDKYNNNNKFNLLINEYNKLINNKLFLRKNNYTSNIYLPVNIYRIIQQSIKIYNIDNSEKTDLDPEYLLNEVENLINKLKIIYDNRKLAQEINNKSLKLFKIMIREKLSSKIIIFKYRISKISFDYIIQTIYNMFLKSIAHPGEMVGCISAQSIGEPCTQLCCHRSTKIKIKINDVYYEPSIGNIIDNYMNLYKNNVIQTDITNSGKKSLVLPIPKNWNIKVPGLNYKTQKIEWHNISLMTKNPPNGKLVKITTKSGKSIIATLSHAFVSKNKYGNPYTIRGDQLKIGMKVPIMC